MKEFYEIFTNISLLCTILGWFFAQILKIIVVTVQNRRFTFVSLVSSGGMPSSHSAAVCALTTSIGMNEGFGTSLFALSVLFAFIVMYDATGVRRETGRQAKVLNALIEDIGKGRSEQLPKHLKELIGHSPVQVFAGAILGILTGFLLNWILS